MRSVFATHAPRVLLAFDKFKGTMTAAEACAAAERGVRRAKPDAAIVSRPVADGGDGTLEALSRIPGLTSQFVEAPNAVGSRKKMVRWLSRREPDGSTTAFVELAAASGLAMLREEERDPRIASTWGTGLVMRAAAEAGARRVVVGLGGSATNDGGVGIASAFGYRFYDSAGREIRDLPRRLAEVAHIKTPSPALELEVVALADVANPLLGPNGATAVYGPQKGVTPEMAPLLEEGLRRLADAVKRDLRRDPRDAPGAGAAGGCGFGLMAFFGARLEPGFSYLSRVIGLEEEISRADVVFTGEGRLDSQTLQGKAPRGVADMAKRFGKPVVAVAGCIDPEARVELAEVFDEIIPLASSPSDQGFAMREAGPRLEAACRALFSRRRSP